MLVGCRVHISIASCLKHALLVSLELVAYPDVGPRQIEAGSTVLYRRLPMRPHLYQR